MNIYPYHTQAWTTPRTIFPHWVPPTTSRSVLKETPSNASGENISRPEIFPQPTIFVVCPAFFLEKIGSEVHLDPRRCVVSSVNHVHGTAVAHYSMSNLFRLLRRQSTLPIPTTFERPQRSSPEVLLREGSASEAQRHGDVLLALSTTIHTLYLSERSFPILDA